MSWSLQVTGTRAAVKAAVQAAIIPAGIKAAIVEVCDDPKPYKLGLLVTGYGHNNDGKSCESTIRSLTVEPVDLAKEPDTSA